MYLSKKRIPPKITSPLSRRIKMPRSDIFFGGGVKQNYGGQFFLLLGGRILGIFRPFSVTNERPEISALFPGKRADFSFSAWAEGVGRRADFTEGHFFARIVRLILIIWDIWVIWNALIRFH